MSKNHFLSRLNSLRGLFAMQVVLGHVVQYENSPIHIWGRFMIISVAFFFFISAMGLSSSFEKKSDYLKGFPRKKILYLLCITLLAYIFVCLLEIMTPIGYLYFQPQNNILLVLYTTTNWYVFELIFFYFIFFITFKFISSNALKLCIITLFTVIIMFLSYVFLYEAYYASSLAFPLGIAFSLYYEKISKFLKSVWGYILTLLLISAGLSCFVLNESFISMLVFRNAMCIGALFIIFYLSKHFDLTCKFTTFLAKYSTEFYFLQFCLILHINDLTFSWPVRCLLAIVVVFISSMIVAPVRFFLQKKIFS